MTDNRNSRKYYWLKLNENFFEREEIKVIESMQNGKDYIIFYMKLLLKSVGTEGVLKFRDVIPYTPEMLSSITNTSVDTVKVAIDIFTKLGLMEMWDDGTLFMSETQNMIGSETGWAKKKREQRQREDNVPLKKDIVPQLSPNCPTEKEIDIEIDKDYKNNSGNFSKIVQVFENNGFGTINITTKEMIVNLIETYSGEWTLEAIEIAVKSNKRNLGYVEGILKKFKSEGKNTEKNKKVDDPYAGVEVY